MAFKNAAIMVNIAASRGLGIVVSMLRMKVVTVVLGPAGIALLSNLNLFVITVKTIAGLGVNESSVREIAQAQGNPARQDKLIHLVLTAHLVQILPVLAVLLIASRPLASLMLDTPDLWWLVAAASAAVLAEMLVLVCAAAFLGTRRTVEFAYITLISGVLATLLGSALTWEFGRAGLLGFLIAQPIFTVVIGYLRWQHPLAGRSHLFGADRPLYSKTVRGGVKLMVSAILPPLSLLIVQSLMIDSRGIDVAGQYSAAVSIATQYVGMFIAATGTDFYPKLSAEMAKDGSSALASKSITDQTRLSLALFAPPLLLLMIFAKPLVYLLLSQEFEAAIPLLRALILASLIPLAFTPLSFSVVAGGHHSKFLWRNIISGSAFVMAAYFIFDKGPLYFAAFPFILQHGLNAAISTRLAIKLCSIQLPARLWAEICTVIAAGLAVFYATEFSPLSWATGGTIFCLVAFWSVAELWRLKRGDD